MKLNKNQIDMLYRVACAEYFTSPARPANYDRLKVINKLVEHGLVVFRNGLRLTDTGRTMLALVLDEERAEMLKKLREQRERTQQKGPKS